jgi:flagellar L-ring protein precursor FlgH
MRWIGGICVALCAGVALGQVQGSGRQSPAVAVAQQLPDYGQGGGNSLLRAGSAMPVQQPDAPGTAGQSRMSAVSLLAVPPPQPKMLKKHDLIQIIIREQAQASSKGNTDASKETEVNAQLDAYVRLSGLNLKGMNPADPLRLAGNSLSDFKADATKVREDSFVTRIGAEVIDVKPNGTLVIQARKRIKLDEEEQEYVLSGVCRVDDIGPDNTVLSTQLHDMDLVQITKGIIRDTNDRGFLTKLLAKLNPF